MDLNKRVLGSGVTNLIILHGIFGQLDNWNTLGRKFAEKYTVHLLDLRNHGRSPHSDKMTHELMSEDVVRYIKINKLDRVVLLGHSMGGKVAMQAALNHPHLIEKLIVADMAPKSYPPHHQSILKGLQSVDFTKITKRSQAETALEEYIPEYSVRQFLLKNIYRNLEGKYAFRFNLESLAKNYSRLVQNELPDKTFTHPTLFIKGGNSEYITNEDRPLIDKYFPNYSIKTIPDTGHWLHAENPAEFFDIISEFVKNF